MGGKSGNKELTRTQTQTNNVSIPGFLRPLIEQSAGVAGGALGGLQDLISGGNLVSPFSEDQQSAFGLARQLALGPDSPLALATSQLADTASGGGFNSDAFNNAFGAAVRSAQPGVISPFISAGRGTGGLASQALGQSQADAFARLFSGERGRQQQAALALPSAALAPFGLLSGIGDQQQAQAQRELSAPISAQQSLLGSALGGLPISSLLGQTGTATQTQPLFQNRGAGILGAGLSGLGLLSGIGKAGGIRGLLGGIF